MIKTLLLITVAVSVFADVKGDTLYRKTMQSSRPVSFWLLGETSVPLIKNHLQIRQPVLLEARELLVQDSESGFFIIQNLAEDKIKYSLYQPSGETITTFSRYWDLDLPLPKILIDHQRERIISLDLTGFLQVRTFSGAILWQRALATNPVFTYENTYGAALNEESGEITAVFSQPSKEGDPRWETQLFVVTSWGDVLKKRVFKKAKLLKMDMTADGSRAVLMLISPGTDRSGKKRTRTLVFDKAQNILWESDFQYRKVLFADRDHILLMGKNKTRFTNIKTGHILWELTEPKRIFDSAVLTKNGFAVLVSGRPEYADGALFYHDTHIYQTDCFKYQIHQTIIPEAEFIPGNIRQTPKGGVNLGCKNGIYTLPGLDNSR